VEICWGRKPRDSGGQADQATRVQEIPGLLIGFPDHDFLADIFRSWEVAEKYSDQLSTIILDPPLI
jgi:hypothetical protein